MWCHITARNQYNTKLFLVFYSNVSFCWDFFLEIHHVFICLNFISHVALQLSDLQCQRDQDAAERRRRWGQKMDGGVDHHRPRQLYRWSSSCSGFRFWITKIQQVVKNHGGSERYSSTFYSLSDDIFNEYYKQNPTSRLNVSSVCFSKTTDNFKLNASLWCNVPFWINIRDLASNTFGPHDLPWKITGFGRHKQMPQTLGGNVHSAS